MWLKAVLLAILRCSGKFRNFLICLFTEL